MTIRTTFAFDPASMARLERLSKRWGVSKSETLRRALERAEIATASATCDASMPDLDQIAAMTPRQALDWLRAHPLVSKTEGARWRDELRQTREDFSQRP